MNTLPLGVCLCVLALGLSTAGAQVVIPATPTNFTKRSTGSGAGTSVTTSQAPASQTVRYTLHVAMSQPRQWSSADGKTLLGTLIAYEEVTAETKLGAPTPEFTRPANPTVVKDGKARLLIDKKPFEIPLDRLSQADREFIEKVRLSASKSNPPKPK